MKLTRLLLLHGADVFAHFSVDGWTALHSACHGGHDHIAKLLVEEAKSLHENTFQEGWSLLHLIVFLGFYGWCRPVFNDLFELPLINLRLAATERLLNRGAELVCWVLKQMPNLEAGGIWMLIPLFFPGSSVLSSCFQHFPSLFPPKKRWE